MSEWNSVWSFQTSDQKTSSTKCFPFDLKIPKTENGFIPTGNRIKQTGNGIIFLISKLRYCYIMLGVTPYVLFGLSCSLCVTHYVLLLLVTHYVFLVICYMFGVTRYMLLVRCRKIILGLDR